MKNEYWKPEPKQRGFSWWALLVPAIIYSAGVIIYAHNAFVPGLAQKNGHEIGSALMVLGGESGTLAAAAEVFRKQANKQTVWLDWIGLAVSLVATLGNLLVVYVALAVYLDAPWVTQVRLRGPLILLLCSGVDFYSGLMEFGFYNASYESRWTEWNDAKHSWESAQDTKIAKTGAQLNAKEIGNAQQVNNLEQERASDTQTNANMGIDKSGLRNLLRNMNGESEQLAQTLRDAGTKAPQALGEWLYNNGYVRKPESTLRTWVPVVEQVAHEHGESSQS